MQFSADFRADAIGCVWRGKTRAYYTAMAGVALAGGVGIIGMDKGDEWDLDFDFHYNDTLDQRPILKKSIPSIPFIHFIHANNRLSPGSHWADATVAC